MSFVMGVFRTIEGAEDTVKTLLDAGFTDDDIGVIVRDTQKGTVIADDIGREYASGATPQRTKVMSRSSVWDRFPEDYGEYTRREGLPSEAMTWYQQRLDGGDIVMIINAHDRMDDVCRMIREHDGEIYRGTTAPREAMAETPETVGGEFRLPIIDEEVLVEKRRHQVGEVRVTREQTSEAVDIPTVVTHEQVRVERRRLEHPVTPDEYRGRQGMKDEVCMPIVEEEIEVVKRPVIREELVITRRQVSEQQTIRETVTHTEPRVEKTGDVEIHEEKRRDEAA
ncbi:MAG: YsnF/AvaK domain-containing protein [Armatimonadota bacterium]